MTERERHVLEGDREPEDGQLDPQPPLEALEKPKTSSKPRWVYEQLGEDSCEESIAALPAGASAQEALSLKKAAHSLEAGTLSGEREKSFFRLVLSSLSTAFVASVAYVDPGNFATNIQAGSQFGYMLLWVVLLANVMAMLFQLLSVKLGRASGYSLARCCREHLHPYLTFLLWLAAELAVIATDIAEFVGASVGLQILFNIPLIWGGVLTTLSTLALLVVHERGVKLFESAVIFFVSIIAVCYIVETIIDKPDWALVAEQTFVPHLAGTESILLAVGIVGATVMPHAIFLHSGIVQDTEKGDLKDSGHSSAQRSISIEAVAIGIALGIAGFVNLSVLIMSASAFHTTGLTEIATLEGAFETLTPILGPAASYIFAIGLVSSGISSSAVGTLAGQIVMEGFLEYKVSMWIRRFVTVVPSLAVILSGADPTRALVVSQVVLSFCIPFALLPLLYFTSYRADVMGEWLNSRLTTAVASLFAVIVIGMNVFLVFSAAL